MKLVTQAFPSSNTDSYLAAISSLTPKETVIVQSVPAGIENTPLSLLFSPLIILGSIVLFFVVFLGILFIQVMHKSFDYKKAVASLVVAFVIASIPISLKTALEVTSLQTRAGPDDIPRNISITQVSATSAVVQWETKVEKLGTIKYGLRPLVSNQSEIVIANDGRSTTLHRALLKNLEPGQEYELEILSGKNWYDDNGQPIQFEHIK